MDSEDSATRGQPTEICLLIAAQKVRTGGWLCCVVVSHFIFILNGEVLHRHLSAETHVKRLGRSLLVRPPLPPPAWEHPDTPPTPPYVLRTRLVLHMAVICVTVVFFAA